MAKIKAFKAIRPTRDKAPLVASRSYLSYSENTLREKLLNNPYTFLHIINPESSSNSPLLEGVEKFKMIKNTYKSFCEQGVFLTETNPCLYIYQQVKEGTSYTGIIAASSVDDYLDGRIKIHEQTISKREEMFSNYLEHTGFNAEPVLLSYSKVPRVNDLLALYMKERSEYEFTSTNRVLHKLWLIEKESDIKELQDIFDTIDSVYIADGHHRSASSALYCKKRRAASEKTDGTEAHNYFMSFLIDDEQLSICDFNRLITDLNGLSIENYLASIAKVYVVDKQEGLYKPKRKDEISMYLNKTWYSLVARKHTFDASDCVENLDPAILSKNILNPIHGIADIRNDKRIEFLDGKQGLKGLELAVDSGKYSVAFALKPITFEQLKQVADQNQIMPPKSTYIEPKLRSGLTIYQLSDD